jgi:histidinol phosphatase-like enzyme
MLEAGRQIIDASESNSRINLQFDIDWKDRPDESCSVMVGDRGVDMEAATNFGVRGIEV